MKIKHKFINYKINVNTEILIIGTFNPDIKKNDIDFFYGRKKNFLWKLLPKAYQEFDLSQASIQKKISFLNKHKIYFVDLISEIEIKIKNENKLNYSDILLDNKVTEWHNIIYEIEKLNNLKKICFTRKTFNNIPKIKNEVEKIQNYCYQNCIEFKTLISPARYYNENKQTEWTNFFACKQK